MLQAKIDITEFAQKQIEFYKIFDKWHCGLNQLKTFKKLSFGLHIASSDKIKQALEVRNSPAK